jgi:hypothetical protein
MSDQDSPFQALEKLVLSSSPERRKTGSRTGQKQRGKQSGKQPRKQTSAPSDRTAAGKEGLRETPAIRPPEQTSARSVVRSARRVKVRYAFEFYQDQIFKLKELRRNAVLNDEDFSMSEVVRNALDKYLESIEE